MEKPHFFKKNLCHQGRSLTSILTTPPHCLAIGWNFLSEKKKQNKTKNKMEAFFFPGISTVPGDDVGCLGHFLFFPRQQQQQQTKFYQDSRRTNFRKKIMKPPALIFSYYRVYIYIFYSSHFFFIRLNVSVSQDTNYFNDSTIFFCFPFKANSLELVATKCCTFKKTQPGHQVETLCYAHPKKKKIHLVASCRSGEPK